MIAPVVGRTPDSYDLVQPSASRVTSLSRGEQIEAWLQRTSYCVTSFVILDDEDDMGIHIDKLIRTSSEVGLTLDEARRAADILNRPPCGIRQHKLSV